MSRCNSMLGVASRQVLNSGSNCRSCSPGWVVFSRLWYSFHCLRNSAKCAVPPKNCGLLADMSICVTMGLVMDAKADNMVLMAVASADAATAPTPHGIPGLGPPGNPCPDSLPAFS